jgi:hypothetical protein
MQPNEDERASIRRKQRERGVEDAMARVARSVQESEELRHLHGKPLNLEEPTDEWIVKRFLSQAGFTHPTIEHAREIERNFAEAQRSLTTARKRHDRLTEDGHRPTAAEAIAYNALRQDALDQYREKIASLSRAVRDYNLTVPDAMQRPPLSVERAMAEAEESLPRLAVTLEPPPEKRRASWLDRLFPRRTT